MLKRKSFKEINHRRLELETERRIDTDTSLSNEEKIQSLTLAVLQREREASFCPTYVYLK